MKPGELFDSLVADITERVGMPIPGVRASVVWNYDGLSFELRCPTKVGKLRTYARKFRHADLRTTHMTPDQMSLEIINAAYKQWMPDSFERTGKVKRV